MTSHRFEAEYPVSMAAVETVETKNGYREISSTMMALVQGILKTVFNHARISVSTHAVETTETTETGPLCHAGFRGGIYLRYIYTPVETASGNEIGAETRMETR